MFEKLSVSQSEKTSLESALNAKTGISIGSSFVVGSGRADSSPSAGGETSGSLNQYLIIAGIAVSVLGLIVALRRK